MIASCLKLKIADIIIEMESCFSLEKLSKEEKRKQIQKRFKNFLYTGEKKPNILIEVKLVDKLPQILKTRPVFITRHFEDDSENWRLEKKGSTYIYKTPLEGKRQLMLVNKSFERVTAYLFSKQDKGKVWNFTDIVYDFLQVLLINYFAQRNEGIFIHAIGVKDLDGKGLFFAGKSGAGKSTTARLWDSHSQAMVLNDDRIIVRRLNGKFFIYGSPWHGDFSDYLTSRIERAPLEKVFFIYHAPKNKVRRISHKKAFNLLYPALFPTFWDKECLENIASFSQSLVKDVPCYHLGFVNNKRVIGFVRNI